ncbi:hypothetical protein BESB_013800 [Besnoitia besnoiti]|uniref:Uncharacterized protein n=1 Tax=Besnoitia besnoiti TaxID=94643 RepID=A0A2A9M2Q5_BESBE|nr:hypothetical protein BESB_013800 [Besnoitia besnoiti]PFH32768.1 hypothetical protein BESB_013800 [Besnoitia besnoiti]
MRQRLLQPQNENRRLESIFGYSSSSQNFKGFASQRARGERPFFSQAECVPVGPGPLSPFTSRETREDMLRKTDHNWVLKAKGKDPTNLPSLKSIETTVGCSGADDFAAAGAHQAGGTTTAGPLSGEMCSVHPESGVSPSAAMLSKSHRLPATHRAGSNISFVVAEQQVSPSPRPRGHSNAMPYTWTAGAPCQLVFQKPAQDRACELVPGEGIGTPERRNGALDGERLSGEHMGGGRAQKEGRWEALSASLAAGTQAATAVPRDASAMGMPERHLAVASEQSTGPWLHENETSSSPPPVYPSAGVWQKPCEPGAVSFPPHVCADGAYTPSPVRISAPLGGMYVTSAGDRGALPARENVVPPGQPHGEAETARCAAAEKPQEKLPHEGGIQKERGNLYRSFSPPLPRILVEGASAASSHAEPASNSAQGPAPCFFQPERASETVGQGTPTAAGDSPESFHMPEDHPDASDPGAPRPLTEERESMVDLSDARWRDLKRQGYFRLGDKGRTSIKSRIARELRANPELRAQAAAVSGVRSATTKQLYQLAELCGFYDVLPPQFQPTSRPQSSSTLGSPVSPPESRERQLQQAALPPAADVPPPPASSHVQEEAVASCLPQGAMLHSVKHERAQGGAELPVKQAAGQTRAQGAASLWQAYGAPPAQMPHAYYAGEGRQGLEQTSCEGGRSELSPCDATAMQEGSCFPPEVPPTGVTSSFPAQGGEGQQYRGGPSPGESASVGLQNKRSKEASRERASASSNYSASLPISGLGQDGAGPNGVECAAFEVEGGCLQQEAGKQTQGRPTLLWPAQCHSLYAAVSMPGNGVAGSASALALASAGNEETPRSLESALSARTGTVCLSPSSETSLCSTTCASSCLSRTTSRSSSCRRAAHAR